MAFCFQEKVEEIIEKYFEKIVETINYQREATKKTTHTVVADGTVYDIWYKGEGNLHFQLNGVGVDSEPLTDESPILELLRSVNRLIQKR